MKKLPARSSGFSLIELMIAMLIGSVLLIGITSLFSTTSNVNRLENGLARIQENGRFALSVIARDIRMATSTRSIRKGTSESGQVPRDRAIMSTVDLTASGIHAQHGLPRVGGPSLYFIPRSVMMRGHECTAATCFPANVPESPPIGGDHYGSIPALGVTAGSRARGGDVLTLRYVRGSGARASVDHSIIQLAGTDRIDVGPSGLVVLDDYQNTVIVAVEEANQSNLSVLTLSGSPPQDVPGLSGDVRVSDFDSSFITVTYFLRLDQDPSRPGRLVSTLIRRENGDAQEIAQGIERLDFLYQIEGLDRNLHWFNAAELNAATGIVCPENEPKPQESMALATFDAPLCRWRAVRAVEVYLLANTIDDAASAQEPFVYSFLADGSRNSESTPELACDPSFGTCPPGSVTVLPSGLPPGRMARREFQTMVTIRNNAG